MKKDHDFNHKNVHDLPNVPTGKWGPVTKLLKLPANISGKNLKRNFHSPFENFEI